MKKTLPAIILAAVAAACIPFTLAACGDNTESDGLIFELTSDGEYYVVSGVEEGIEGEIVIPETHNDLAVVKINAFAFNGADVTKVTIPASVNEIANGAFNGCNHLESVVFEGNLNSLGDVAFANCTALTEVVLPNGIPAINAMTFMGCSALTDVTIPSSVTTIGNMAFYGCNRLATVHYRGSRTAWLGIAIDAGNEPLDSADIQYNG